MQLWIALHLLLSSFQTYEISPHSWPSASSSTSLVFVPNSVLVKAAVKVLVPPAVQVAVVTDVVSTVSLSGSLVQPARVQVRVMVQVLLSSDHTGSEYSHT